MGSNIPVFVSFAFTTVLLCIAMVMHLEVSEIKKFKYLGTKLELMENIKSNWKILFGREREW